ncbi:hypothetical protein L3Q82_002566 [Scortum barcoo]|uniref:Uncharacterized protein n=1 Tax=Scortum barcoo TaxID=214431 RepID=A0ACB8VUD2_9TELE|nr:hypothetical protein L3Q82_002566 [Scortum barcoo]
MPTTSLPTAATGLSPFQVVFGYQPPLFPANETEVTVPSAHTMVKKCRKIWAAARQMLLRNQSRMKAATDCHRRPAPAYRPGPESLAFHKRPAPSRPQPQTRSQGRNRVQSASELQPENQAQSQPSLMILSSLLVSLALMLLPQHTAAKKMALATTDW